MSVNTITNTFTYLTLCITCVHIHKSVDVTSKTKDFEECFSKLLQNAKSELISKTRSVETFKAKLRVKTLPCSVRKYHYQHIRRVIHFQYHRFIDWEEFFAYLNMYCYNCFEYKLLAEVIKVGDCSAALNNQMEDYTKDVQTFQRNVKCSSLFNHQTSLGSIPPHFEIISTTHQVDPDRYSVADLDAFRKDVCSSVDEPEYALSKISSTPGCPMVTEWIFPSELKNTIQRFFYCETGQRLLQIHSIEVMLIAGKVVYEHKVSFIS